MHVALCVCAEIPHLPLDTRVVLIMHRREYPKTTGTGRLALAGLPNSDLLLHGYQERPVDLTNALDPSRRALLLFPQEAARPLSREIRNEDPRPINLIVPDGNWRQASKMLRRIPGLDRAEPVTLPPGPVTRYALRSRVKPNGLATLEAIARALGILESIEAQHALEAVFELMVQRTLSTRRFVQPVT